MSAKMVLGIIFILEYTFLIFSKKHRALSMWIAVGISLGISMLNITDHSLITFMQIPQFVNWNVIAIFVGTFLLADVVIYSRMPVLLAEKLVDSSSSVSMAILWISILSGVISMFVENVATVLIVAPVAIEVARQQKVSPVPFLIGIAISSNLQGTATLIGDPPSMIMAAHMKMTFNDFFFYQGKFSIFWAIQVGAVLSSFVLYRIFKKNSQQIKPIKVEKVISWIPTMLMILMIMGLASSSNFDPDFKWLAGTICMITGLISIIWLSFTDRKPALKILKAYDIETTMFLTGIFVLVAMVEHLGIVNDIAAFIQSIVGTNVFVVYTAVVLASVLFSAFIDNVPYIMTMMPVVSIMSHNLNVSKSLLMFGLLIGACLGGNITPIGASANIVSIGLLKKEGYNPSFWDFVKIGLPFTIAAVLGGYLFIWFIWS